jgi:NADH:ubiquinone oxidoreductase subunit
MSRMTSSFGRIAAIAGGQLVKKNTRQVTLTSSVQTRTLYGVFEKYYEAYKRYGLKDTIWKLYNVGDVKFGKCVGEDQFGNKYYEDPTNLAHQQRWTEFKVNSFDDFEGSNIPPQWHVWMQQTTDSLPTEDGQKVSLFFFFCVVFVSPMCELTEHRVVLFLQSLKTGQSVQLLSSRMLLTRIMWGSPSLMRCTSRFSVQEDMALEAT